LWIDPDPNAQLTLVWPLAGKLLDGLAHCPTPAISGFLEAPFTLEMHEDRERRRRYNES